MVIANAHTVVTVEKSVSEIERYLRLARVSTFSRRYTPAGQCCAITFELTTPVGERTFFVPVDVEQVYQRLEHDWRYSYLPKRYVSREHAARVAWRCVRDWIRAQLALVSTGLATTDRAMMAYLETLPGRTLYEDVTEGRVSLPLALPAPKETSRVPTIS